jgi:cytochrome c oxidase subunit 2
VIVSETVAVRSDAARRLVALAAVILTASACSGIQSALDVRGPGAARIAELWWFMLAAGGAVYVAVLVLLSFAVFRRRPEDGAAPTERRHAIWIIGGGVLVSAVVLAAVFAATLRALGMVHPGAHDSADPADLTVQVTGSQWWWDVRYPGGSSGDVIATANEIRIPTGRRVRLELRSTDVIHSLWVPNLQGKTDLIPGRTTVTWLEADQPGISRGQCAEYCGMQHANMALIVIAESPRDFERWLAQERLPAQPAADSLGRAGQDVFMSAGCAICHTVRGTPAAGRAGPDLTHFASRRTIAAGTLSSDRENLTAWIASPQVIKPGSLMPSVPLDPEQLRAVVRYLETLQ